jgi:glycosidase
VPFIYYGEEIGMLGSKPDERIRAPMQWSGEANSSFSSGAPWEALNPDFPTKNVAAQAGDPNSLLAHYQALVHLRNAHAALRIGDTLLLKSCNPAVLAFLRYSGAAGAQEHLLVILNLGGQAVSACALNLPAGLLSGGYRAAVLMGWDGLRRSPAPLIINAQGGFDTSQPYAQLPAYSTLILQLQEVSK